MIVNVWLAVSDAAQAVVLESLNWGDDPYTGPLRPRSRKLFEYMQDQATRRALFSSPEIGGVTYNLWSIDFDDAVETLQLIKDEIDFLIAQYPNQISVLGAWNVETGAQVGGYTIPNYVWRFMPVEDGATSNADLRDVNTLYGQAPRDFS